ncbi:MAG: isoleucine--tRNA ligase [Verrucomicrobiota bacterium]|nr:isoleucine--tRNA ligase [Verrucomicrobiota bacterium]
MDYKNTLNLPQTDFPMKADLIKREPERLRKWDAAGLYAAIQARRAGAEKFVLHDGPPFANGEVHIGTALNKILKDIIIKYKTLRGFHAPYVPGWDCHGLPIEFKVMQDMRKAGNSATDAASIRQACETYARKYIDLQRAQFQRLGVLGDWANPYLTFAKEYEADELRLFAGLVEQGMVYRGKKPVYWSIPCRTALAEAEVEYKDHVSQSVYVKFPLVGHPGTSVVIWTTTPWTLPANLAVAYNSTFHYSLVLVGREQYIVSALLLPAIAAKCGWQDYQIVRSLEGGHLAQMEYQHPFCRRTGKFFKGDSFVDNTTGTGFVHIAPGHGLEDYHLGIEQGLPVYSPVDDDGKFVHTSDLPAEQQMPAEMLGRSVGEKHGKSEANEAVLHELRARQALLHQENYTHSYPHCWRSKTPIIFRAMAQWFIKIDHAGFRDRALAEIQRVHWVPEWGRSRIEAAVKGRPDWCISRQRTWGVPIPAFYDASGNPILDPRIVRNAADLFEQHGSNVWFERSAAELWAALQPADWTGPASVAKSNDTLDVWIDSGSSSRAVIARRPEIRGAGHPFQCDMYLEGSDQHRGWFQSSLLLSLAGNGAAPYRTVLTHGFMVDADREKISKSQQGQGGYEKPQTAEAYVKKWGADIIRLWVASQDFRNDIIVSEERIQTVAETYRVLRNALRYELANLADFDPAAQAVPDGQLTGLDRWILDEFSQLERDVLAAYDRHEFHVVYQRVSQFVAVELSALYHDVVKDRLYTDPANAPRRRSTQTALYRLVTGLCRLLSPILAFTADEAWEFVPGRTVPSVHLLTWEPLGFERPEDERAAWRTLLELRERALPELEKARQAKSIGKALEAKLTFAGAGPELATAQAHRESLRELLNVSQLEIQPTAEAALTISLARAAGEKCGRCWHWETHVGVDAGHPTLCARCAQAVRESVPA